MPNAEERMYSPRSRTSVEGVRDDTNRDPGYRYSVSYKNTLKTTINTYIGCNKIIAPCTLYTKNGIFYFCNRSNR